MPIMKFYGPMSMSNWGKYFGDDVWQVLEAKDNLLILEDGSGLTRYVYGSFNISSAGEISGTIKSAEMLLNGVLLYEGSQYEKDWSLINEYSENNDYDGYINYIFGGADTFHGSPGNDTLLSYGGNDRLFGYGGNDVLSGGTGNDQLFGGGGHDTLSGEDGDDKVYGDTGDDELLGGNGKDFMSGGSGADTANGGTEDDEIYGGFYIDTLNGNAGNDKVSGGNGHDILIGEAGADNLIGGTGNDDISGGSEDDILNGGSGNDKLAGDAGNDTIIGGFGTDTAVYDFHSSNATIVDQGGGYYTVSAFGFTDDVYSVEQFQFTNETILLQNQTGTSTPSILLASTSDTGASASDGITADPTPLLVGAAPMFKTIEILSGPNIIGVTNSGSTGDWEFVAPELADGVHYITARYEDPNSATPIVSAELTLTIDTQPPGAPTITGFTQDTGVVGDGITEDSSIVLTGESEAGAIIDIFAGPLFSGSAAADGIPASFDASTFIATSLMPDPVKASGLKLLVEEVGQVLPALRQNNLAAPVVIGNDLYVVDQRGSILKQTVSGFEVVFDISLDAPAGLTLTDRESIINISEGPGDTVYVGFTSSTLPSAGFSFEPLPDGSSQTPGGDDPYATSNPLYQIIYKFDLNPISGAMSNPVALAAFKQANSQGDHSGGGMLTLPNGDLLFARGDNLGADRDGLASPQDPSNTVGKLLIIDQVTGEITVAALGVRNVQKLGYVDESKTEIAFADIGAATAEEINIVSTSNLLDRSVLENFGWGRIAGDGSDGSADDGTAREGTFYINDGATSVPGTITAAIGAAPAPEPGFIQPYAEFGREGSLSFFAVAGPVFSDQSFKNIKALFTDFVSGQLYATTEAPDGTGKDVFSVSLVDVEGNPVTLSGLTSVAERADARVFNFPDGSASVLLEREGMIYRLTEIDPDVQGNWSFTTENLSADQYSFSAVASDLAGNISDESNVLNVEIIDPSIAGSIVQDDFLI